MPNTTNVVNLSQQPTVALLANVALAKRGLDHAINRPAHLPGIVALHGPAGWGKTTASAYCANKARAFYVEVKSTWTKKALLKAILTEMGVEPLRTNYDMVDQVAEHLALHHRPLIIDEFDYCIQRGMVDLVRDLYESSNAPIMIIGEEKLEPKLRPFDRFHSRILEWMPAQPSDFSDAQQLAKLYCQSIKVADDLLKWIVDGVKGNTRKIAVNLETARQIALRQGLEEIDLEGWGKEPLYTGRSVTRNIDKV